MDEKRHACKEYDKNRSPANFERKREAIRHTNSLRTHLQQSFIRDSIARNKGDAKKTWQTIKKFWPYLNKQSTNIGKQDSDNVELANSFNEFFANVGHNLANDIPDTQNSPLDFQAVPQIFELMELELNQISQYMKDLKPSTSCGTDGITARLLKAAGESIYPVLLHICNLSIRKSIFPTLWKTGCITPIHKAGDTISPNNFRPISVIHAWGSYSSAKSTTS